MVSVNHANEDGGYTVNVLCLGFEQNVSGPQGDLSFGHTALSGCP